MEPLNKKELKQFIKSNIKEFKQTDFFINMYEHTGKDVGYKLYAILQDVEEYLK